MTTAYGRVVKAAEREARPVRFGEPKASIGRRIPREVVSAIERAQAIIADAEKRAQKLAEDAERHSAAIRLKAEAQARAEAFAAIAAQAVVLSERERRLDDQQREHLIDVARLLAERLLGEALRLDPQRVAALARTAIADTRGAQHITILAHPDDVAHIERAVSDWGLAERTLRVAPDPDRKPGNLRFETEIGALDAEIGPQLDRLAAKVREGLRQAR